MTAALLARLLGVSLRKMSKRLLALHRAGHVKRTQLLMNKVISGRPEYVYFTGSAPKQQVLAHTLGIAELGVLAALAFPADSEYHAEFFYGNELPVRRLYPDAALLVHRGAKTALVMLEYDRGTERAVSPTSYSLLTKLRAYETYLDSSAAAEDFAWAGTIRGFRVALILHSEQRLRNVLRMLVAEHLDFVLLATTEDLQQGLRAFVWRRAQDDRRVDVLGREAL